MTFGFSAKTTGLCLTRAPQEGLRITKRRFVSDKWRFSNAIIHLSRYGLAAVDPYLLSLDVLVERFCLDVGEVSGGGLIVAERRHGTLDRELDLAWLNLKIQGTRFMRASQVEDRILALNLRAKKDNIAGLQLADLVVSPIGRHVLGKPDREDWRVVEAKLRRSRTGKTEGFGLVTLPK